MNNEEIKMLHENLIKDIIKFNVYKIPDNLPLEKLSSYHDNSYFYDLYDFLRKESSSLKNDESIYFYKEDALSFCLVLVHSKYIIHFYNGHIKFMDNNFNLLFNIDFCNISNSFCFSNYKILYEYSLNNKKQGKISFLSQFNETKLNIQNNSLILRDSSIDFVSVKFEKNTFITKFKNSYYSSIKFDYNFNIQEVELSNKLKTTLGISNNQTINNVYSYQDLISKIHNMITPDFLDIYNLMNDSKFKLKTNENKFNRDLSYIKKLVSNNKDFFDFNDKYNMPINDFLKYYEEILLIMKQPKNDIQHLNKYGLENSNLTKYLSEYNHNKIYYAYTYLLFLTFVESFDKKIFINELIEPLIHLNKVSIFDFHDEYSKIKNIKNQID